jgi:hypothetical protein
MKIRLAIALLFLLSAAPRLLPQTPDPLDGVWQGYDGEWRHVSEQLIALAEATPADKFAWRPAPGIRSTSEVYMHIVDANFYLLSVTGPRRRLAFDPPCRRNQFFLLTAGGEEPSNHRRRSCAQLLRAPSRRHILQSE